MADEPPAPVPAAAAEPEEPVPAADAAAEPEEAEAEERDEEDLLMERAQAVISRVVEQEADPNPRLIHTLATICDDQEARSARSPPLPSLSLFHLRIPGARPLDWFLVLALAIRSSLPFPLSSTGEFDLIG
jgi:hypothetical protein